MTVATKKKRDEWIIRIGLLAMAIFFGYSFIYKVSYNMRTQYWLTVDAKQTKVLITKVWGQGVDYKYSVGNKEYNSHSQRDWEHDIGAGQESIAFYSSSHPWLSSLTKPQTPLFQPVGAILFVVFLSLALLVEFLLIMTVINPRSLWVLQILKNQK